jgi:(S)-ureidoglycine aminohydrolase
MKCSLLLIAFMIALQVAGQKTDTLLSGPYYFKNLKQEQSENHVVRQVLKGKTLALKDFEVKAYALLPGKVLRTPHEHQGTDLLVIIKEGELVARINGKDRRLGPGSIAFVMSGEVYAFTNSTTKPATYYLLEYSGRGPLQTGKADSSFALDWNNLKTNNTAKGYRRDFFNRATSQVKQFEMHTTALNAGEVSHAPHTHIQEEIILVLRGHVEMQIGDNFHEGDTGDLFFLSSNTPHALKNIGNEQCEYFAFQWRNQ